MVSGLTAERRTGVHFPELGRADLANLAYVEIPRADTDDYGAVVPIGTAVRGVNMYKDNVGSGATKYWGPFRYQGGCEGSAERGVRRRERPDTTRPTSCRYDVRPVVSKHAVRTVSVRQAVHDKQYQ